MRTPVLLSTLVIAACGGGDTSTTTTISLDTIGPPDLVAFKLGTGDWQILEPDGNRYEIAVDEPYIVAVACNDIDDLFDTYLVARTPEDDKEITAPCTGSVVVDGSVQGTLVQPGEVTVGFASATLDEPGGTFDIEASAGAHDLVALTDTAIAIRRDIRVAGLTVITPAVDLDAEGEALVPAGFTIASSAVEESQFAFARLITEADTFVILGFGDPAVVPLAPDALLGDEDRQLITVTASRDDLSRTVSLPDVRSATARSLTLPEYLSGVTLGETAGTISATWGELPEHDELALTIDQTIGSTFLFHDLQISRAYAEEMGSNIALDLAIPGFDTAGEIDVAADYTRAFAVVKQRDGLAATSRLTETPNQPSEKRRQPARLGGLKPAIRDRY